MRKSTSAPETFSEGAKTLTEWKNFFKLSTRLPKREDINTIQESYRLENVVHTVIKSLLDNPEATSKILNQYAVKHIRYSTGIEEFSQESDPRPKHFGNLNTESPGEYIWVSDSLIKRVNTILDTPLLPIDDLFSKIDEKLPEGAKLAKNEKTWIKKQLTTTEASITHPLKDNNLSEFGILPEYAEKEIDTFVTQINGRREIESN